MNFLDLLVAGAAVGAGVLGYRMGFLRRSASWIGLAAGVVVALAFVDDLADSLSGQEPRARLLVSLAFVFVAATVGQALGFALGGLLHRGLAGAGHVVRRGDQFAGAVVGVVGVLVLLWLLVPAFANAPGWPARAARGSAIVRAIDRYAPEPPPQSETLGRLVGDQTFPEVFNTLTSPDAGTPPPGGIPAPAARRVTAAVVKVEGVACDRVQEGTGFVIADDLVVTNAHVIAGERDIRIDTSDGRRLETSLAAFDPERDVAVLRVDGLGLAPLDEGDGGVGQLGSVFGHPGGGDLRETPMRIAEEIVARGTDITRSVPTERNVFVLAASIAPGDSGAPVVDEAGRVVGVVFAFDISRETTAYALTDEELDAVVGPVLAGTAPAPHGTGSCLAD